MTTPSDEVELLPVATRKGFAEVARDLIQQAPIDASEPPTNRLDSNSQAQNISLGTSSGHNSSYPPRSSSREARKHTKKPSRQSSRKRELREPEKYNPTTGLRGQGTAAEVATTRDPEHAPQNDHQEPDKSLLQTEVSASTQSEFLAAATSPLNEKVPPGSYKRIIIGKGKPIPPGIKLPPHIERYLKMDQPESKKRDDAMTAGYVRQGTPIVTRTPEERDPRLNSVYAQVSSSNPFVGSFDHRPASDEEIRATLWPSPYNRTATLHKDEAVATPYQAQEQRPTMDASPIRDGRKSPDKDNITLQSLAGEWTQDYDKVVSPSAMKTSYEEPPLQQPTTGVNMYSQQRAQHDEDYYRAFQAISEPRPTDEGHRHSPTRVTFVSPQSVQRSDSPRNAQLSAENRMLETRRANASPTRFDLKFKPLPQSPAIQRSDRSSLSSPQYFEYLVPEPLNIPTKHHLPQAQQAQQAPHSPVHEASGIDSAYLDWLRTNEVSQPRDDGQRETVWFQPQPPTRYYTGDPNQPFMYVENPPVRYQKVEQGPVQASVDGMPVYRRPQNENPPHNDRELAEAVIGNHEFNRLQNNRDDRELAEAMIGNYEFKRMQTQSLNRNKHQKAASDYSEFGYRQQYSDGSNRSGQGPALVKSHSQKDYRITPPDMNEYDRVPDLEHTPGGHSRVVQQEDRSSGGSSSGPPRGRSTLRNRRSRSLSPAKKSFDVTQFMEDDEYIFCEDDEVAAAPKRSRSPMKQMFGEKGWLSRGASMNQVASQSPKKKGLKEFAKLVRQKTDDKKADLSKKLGFDPSSSPYPPTTPSSPTRTSKDSAQTAHSQPSSPPEAPPPTGPSGPAVSVPPSEQMRLYGELELLLQTVANNYLHTQKELGHLSPSSVAKVSKAWHNKNRPQVLEFRFDLGTQLDLVRLNSTTLTFYGPRSADPLHKAALFNSWKGVARELGVRTFCNPDAAVKKMVHDSYKMLEMLGAKTPVFLMLQGLQQRVLRRIEEEVVLKPRRERKVRVGVTRQVDIPTAGGIGGSGGSGGNGGPGGEARMERMEKLEENSGIWCG